MFLGPLGEEDPPIVREFNQSVATTNNPLSNILIVWNTRATNVIIARTTITLFLFIGFD